nr:hypothetical protein [Glycomyces harbinensis]
MLTLLLPRSLVSAQHILNPQPRLHLHQRLVLALMEDALIRHDANVVRVPQRVVDAADRQLLAGSLPGGAGTQPFVVENICQVSQRPVAKGVLLKGPAHQRCPFRVKDDRPNLEAIPKFPVVEVADRSLEGRSTLLRLAVHPLEDFHCEVVRVVLRHVGHHVVEQPPRGCLVHRLGHRHQLGPSPSNRGVDLDVVGSVAGETVDLVHHHNVDAMSLKVLQHLLKLRTVRRFGRLASVHVLLHQDAAELPHLPQARFTLRRDRVAL